MELEDFTYRQQIFLTSYMKYRIQKKRNPVYLASDDSGLSYDHCRALLTQPHFKEFIANFTKEQVAEILKEVDVSTAFIIEGYKRIASFDPKRRFKKEKGVTEFLHITEQDKNTRMCDGVTPKDIRGALDSLARIKGMFKDTVAVTYTFKDILDEVGGMGGSDEKLVDDDEE